MMNESMMGLVGLVLFLAGLCMGVVTSGADTVRDCEMMGMSRVTGKVTIKCEVQK